MTLTHSHTNRFISARAWNGCARNEWINATRAANDAHDSTISVIGSRTAVHNGGPGKSFYNCKSNRSSNSNCTNLRYLHTISTTINDANYQTTATLKQTPRTNTRFIWIYNWEPKKTKIKTSEILSRSWNRQTYNPDAGREFTIATSNSIQWENDMRFRMDFHGIFNKTAS